MSKSYLHMDREGLFNNEEYHDGFRFDSESDDEFPNLNNNYDTSGDRFLDSHLDSDNNDDDTMNVSFHPWKMHVQSPLSPFSADDTIDDTTNRQYPPLPHSVNDPSFNTPRYSPDRFDHPVLPGMPHENNQLNTPINNGDIQSTILTDSFISNSIPIFDNHDIHDEQTPNMEIVNTEFITNGQKPIDYDSSLHTQCGNYGYPVNNYPCNSNQYHNMNIINNNINHGYNSPNIYHFNNLNYNYIEQQNIRDINQVNTFVIAPNGTLYNAPTFNTSPQISGMEFNNNMNNIKYCHMYQNYGVQSTEYQSPIAPYTYINVIPQNPHNLDQNCCQNIYPKDGRTIILKYPDSPRIECISDSCSTCKNSNIVQTETSIKVDKAKSRLATLLDEVAVKTKIDNSILDYSNINQKKQVPERNKRKFDLNKRTSPSERNITADSYNDGQNISNNNNVDLNYEVGNDNISIDNDYFETQKHCASQNNAIDQIGNNEASFHSGNDLISSGNSPIDSKSGNDNSVNDENYSNGGLSSNDDISWFNSLSSFDDIVNNKELRLKVAQYLNERIISTQGNMPDYTRPNKIYKCSRCKWDRRSHFCPNAQWDTDKLQRYFRKLFPHLFNVKHRDIPRMRPKGESLSKYKCSKCNQVKGRGHKCVN